MKKNTKANKSETTAPATESEAPKLGKLGGYEGHSVVSVIRLLGKAGWTFQEIRAAFDREGVLAADQTIRIQRKCGADNVGSLAELTVKQIAQLKGKQDKTVSKNKKSAKPAADVAAPAPAVPAADQPLPLAA